MKLTREDEIDPAPLEGKRVAILGYGNQGRAQSLNLKDSGIDVVVGLRERSATRSEAQAAGLRIEPLDEAVTGADVVMLLARTKSSATSTSKSSRSSVPAWLWASATAWSCISDF